MYFVLSILTKLPKTFEKIFNFSYLFLRIGCYNIPVQDFSLLFKLKIFLNTLCTLFYKY